MLTSTEETIIVKLKGIGATLPQTVNALAELREPEQQVQLLGLLSEGKVNSSSLDETVQTLLKT